MGNGDVTRMTMDVSEVLKALADPNRLRILNLLHEKTLCVCDLEAILRLNQSNLSRHLAKLRHPGIVNAQKKALFTYYSRKALPGPLWANRGFFVRSHPRGSCLAVGPCPPGKEAAFFSESLLSRLTRDCI